MKIAGILNSDNYMEFSLRVKSATTEIPALPALPAKQPISTTLSIKQSGGFSAQLFASFMSGVLFKAFLIASSLVTHSIRGILTSVAICYCAITAVVVEERRRRV